MIAGIDNAMILSDQFLPAVFGHFAKFVIRVLDNATPVRYCDDRGRIERQLEIIQLFERTFQTLAKLTILNMLVQLLDPFIDIGPEQLVRLIFVIQNAAILSSTHISPDPAASSIRVFP